MEVVQMPDDVCRCSHKQSNHKQLYLDGLPTPHFPCQGYGCECGVFEGEKMLNEIYKGLPHELDAELKEIESVLFNVQTEFPQIARDAAKKRYAYEIAKAKAIDEIERTPLADGQKKPTVAAMEAKADLEIAMEMEATRNATAELEIAKVVFDSVKTRLTSIQTRSKMTQTEMSLSR